MIPYLLTLVEYPPNVWSKYERVGKQLENDVAVTGSISAAPQRRQTDGVRRVVCEVEATLEPDVQSTSVRQSNASGVNQPLGFSRIRRFRVNRSIQLGKNLKKRCHARS